MKGSGGAAWVDVLPSMGRFATNMTRGVTSAARTAGQAAGRQFSSSVNAGAKAGGGATALVKELEEAAKRSARAVQAEKVAIQKARSAEVAATQKVTAAETTLQQRRAAASAAAKSTAAAESALVARRSAMDDAIRTVSVQESALNEARTSGKMSAAQLSKMEATLAAARTRAESASQAVMRGEVGIEAARARELASSSQITAAEASLTTARGRSEAATSKSTNTLDALKAAQNENRAVTDQLSEAQKYASTRAGRLSDSLDDVGESAGRSEGWFTRASKGARGLAGAALSAVKPLAGMAAGFALIVGAGNVISLGNEYTATMNELGAVSNATSSQMQQFRTVTRELGSDLTLPATSGKDAAGVLLELAKGGLTASQSMDAARGTILLAAAAQVDGARAAEIQSNAINQFGLKAKDASMVADVLANTANAAAGGVDDIATSMKYVGPVARSMGISIGDTASSIGLLANNGLKGDTAGTALRGMLVSLAAPSKKAGDAIASLNIEAFDSNGKFVGMRKVIEQLSVAQKEMTKEQFAGAAAVAFGREPLAAVTALASSGAGAYDKMTASVTRQGGAADVANSKMQGLGGAMDKLQSQLEDVALGIYDTVTPFLTGAVNGIAGYLDAAGGGVSRFLKTAGGLATLAIGGRGQMIPSMPGIDPAVVQGILTAHDVVMAAFGDIRSFVVDSLIPSLANIATVVGPVAALVGGILVGAFRLAAGVLKMIGPPLVAVTGWMRDNQTLVLSLAGAIGVLVTAYKIQAAIVSAGSLMRYVASMRIVVATQKVWNAVMVAFNIISNANPIGLIIVAIVALVAALVIAYQRSETFRNIVQGALAGVVTAVKWVGAAFVWLWTNGIKPAIAWISTAAMWLWNSVLKPTFDGIAAAVRFVVLVVTTYVRMWIAIFQAVGRAIAYVWTNYISPVFELIGAMIRVVVGAAFSWLWSSVIQPVTAWISTAILWLWTNAISPALTAVANAVRWVGSVFSWLWTNAISPVLTWIAAAAVRWWQQVSSSFMNVVRFVRDVLGTVFTWLRDTIIRPVFNGIRDTISRVWNGGIKPIFDKIASVARDTIPKAFRTMRDGVGKAWEFMKSAAKAPIKFVVNTVVNDALIGNFNKVATAFGTKKMPRISLPDGFAGGGIIPGYQSAKRDDQMRPMRSGEGVLVPEVVRALGPGFVHGLNRAGNSGGVRAVRNVAGYAKGGIVGAATAGWDWAKGAAGKAWDWTKNAAETAANVVRDPLGTLGKLVKSVIGKIPGAGRMTEVAGGMGRKVLDGAIAAIKRIGESDGAGTGKNGDLPKSSLMKVSGFAGGPGVGPMGGYLRIAAARAWEAMQKASGGALGLTEGYRDLANQNKRWAMYKAGGNLAAVPGSSVHGLGNAADIGAGQGWARSNGARYGWVNTGLGFSQREPWHFEYRGSRTAAGGMSTGGIVEPTLYDNGGYLPVGTSLVANKTGRPEPVFTSEQFAELRRERSSGRSDGDTTVIANIGGTGNHHEDIRDVKRALRDREHGGRGGSSR